MPPCSAVNSSGLGIHRCATGGTADADASESKGGKSVTRMWCLLCARPGLTNDVVVCEAAAAAAAAATRRVVTCREQ